MLKTHRPTSTPLSLLLALVAGAGCESTTPLTVSLVGPMYADGSPALGEVTTYQVDLLQGGAVVLTHVLDAGASGEALERSVPEGTYAMRVLALTRDEGTNQLVVDAWGSVDQVSFGGEGGGQATVVLGQPGRLNILTEPWSAAREAPPSSQALLAGLASFRLEVAPPTTAARASFAARRAYHTLSPVGDGALLAIGGAEEITPGASAANAFVERFGLSLTTGAMISEYTQGGLEVARVHHTATPLGGDGTQAHVLVVGGDTRVRRSAGPWDLRLEIFTGNAGPLSSMELYSAADDTFVRPLEPTLPRSLHGAVAIGSSVLVAGGVGLNGEGGSLRLEPVVERLDLKNATIDVVALTPALTTPRVFHTLAAYPRASGGDAALLCGGISELIPPAGAVTSDLLLDSCERLQATSVGDSGPTMVEARAGATATSLPDGRILIAGGLGVRTLDTQETVVPIDTVEIYDPDTDQFTLAVGQLAWARSLHQAVPLSDGRVLLVGGQGRQRDSLPVEILTIKGEAIHSEILGAEALGSLWGEAAAPLPGGRALLMGGAFQGRSDASDQLGLKRLYVPQPQL